MTRHWNLGLAGIVLLAAACGGSERDKAATPTSLVATETTMSATTVADTPETASTPVNSGITADGPGTTDRATPGVAASCAFEYNAATLAERTWAFDGTLIAISTGDDSRLGPVETATFAVNHWFKGGAGDDVTVQFNVGPTSEFAPTADIGTRLLVAGEPRWGGQPLDDAVAWECGFTQPWTSPAADQWSTVFGPPDRPDATPIVSHGTSTVRATLMVCGPACDGPAMLGEAPNFLIADGQSDIVVHVAPPYSVSARWDAGEFGRLDSQTVVAAAPPPGCHRMSITVTGIGEYDSEFVIVILGDSNSDCA